LNSSDPFDHPLIDPNYLSHSSDLNVLVEAFKELHSIVKSSPKFKDLYDFETNCAKCNNASIFDEIPCDEFIKCISKERFLPPLHLTSSCPMGSDNDPKSVVDSSLKVRHVEGLRVIDASVMPQTIEPGTYAPTAMIGEKGSQLIKDDHKFSSFQFV
jgi:choline dehydrogenase